MKIKNIRIYLTVMICVLFAGCGQITDDTDKQEGIVFENESVREAVLEALDRTSDEFIVDVHSGEIQTQLDPIGNLCATDGELALVLGVEVAEFEDNYDGEPIPSTSTPTQLIGEEVIDGELVKWFFMDYEDISIEYTNYYNSSIQSVDRPYIISGYRMRTSRFKTEKDIYVGDTLAQVEEAYGDALYQD